MEGEVEEAKHKQRDKDLKGHLHFTLSTNDDTGQDR